MSIKVRVDELDETLERFGWLPFLVTTGDNGVPHLTHVELERDADGYRAVVGRRTAANVSARPAVVLLWPTPEPGTHSLIADAQALVIDGEGEPVIRIRPSGAVLHRPAGAERC